MDFQTAAARLTDTLGPRPWDLVTDGGKVTLTIVPAGVPEDPGYAEVTLRISVPGRSRDTEAGVPSRDLAAMIDALTSNRMWTYYTLDDVEVTLLPFGGGGMILTVSADPDALEDQPQVHIPETERRAVESALRNALAVARGWED